MLLFFARRRAIGDAMRWVWTLWMLAACLAAAVSAEAATGRVIKVLPEFLDLQGRNSLTPSLYERDAYQVKLRDHPKERSGMCFYVNWKTKGAVWEPLVVRLEVRGTAQGKLPENLVLEQLVENRGGWFSHWTEITLKGEAYKKMGSVTAWRVTLWEGRQLLGEQKSFLW